MGNKPNWGRGLSALGRSMMDYASAKDRQGFMEKERRLQEQARLTQMKELREMMAAQEQARYERDNPLVFPGGVDMPFGTNMPADIRMREAGQRLSLQKAMAPETSDRMMVTGNDGRQYPVTPFQAYNIDNPPPPKPGAELFPFTDPLGVTTMLDPAKRSIEIKRWYDMGVSLGPDGTWSDRPEKPSEMDKAAANSARIEERAIAREGRAAAAAEFSNRLSEYKNELVPYFGDDKYLGEWEELSDGTARRSETRLGADWLNPDTVKPLSAVLAEALAPKLKDGVDAVEHKIFHNIAKSKGVPIGDLYGEWAKTGSEYIKQIDGKWYINVDGEWMEQE